MNSYTISVSEEAGGDSGLGGSPHLPAGYEWPLCATCQKKMVFLMQVTVPDDLGFKPGSHLCLFTCLEHCDPVMPPGSEQLKPEFWKGDEYTQYFLSMHAGEGSRHPAEELVLNKRINLAAAPDELNPEIPWPAGKPGLKLGGTPSWCQDPEKYNCSCGAAMKFVLQIPENFPFPPVPGAPNQTNSIGPTYMPFLGNEIYVHACSNQCHPQALWPVAQN